MLVFLELGREVIANPRQVKLIKSSNSKNDPPAPKDSAKTFSPTMPGCRPDWRRSTQPVVPHETS
jgi:hypothetical protein